MRTSVNLLDGLIGDSATVIGTPVRGAGWYGPNSGLHSVSVRVLNFVGRVSIQATLATLPLGIDWFSVMPEAEAYWQYPRARYLGTMPGGETSTLGFNFLCNAVWVRAVVDRSYLGLSSAQPAINMGTVDRILLNY